MAVTLNIDTTRFNKMIKDKAFVAGIPLREAVVREVPHVLQTTLKRTRAASLKKMREQVKENNADSPEYEARTDRGNPKFVTLDGKKYAMTNRYSAELWKRITKVSKLRAKQRLQELRAKRGLAKKSWLYAGRLMNVELQAPNYVRNAKAPGINDQKNVSKFVKQGGRFFIQITNQSPTATSFGARGKLALSSAMRGRVRQFEIAMDKGFDKLALGVVQRHPGHFVRN